MAKRKKNIDFSGLIDSDSPWNSVTMKDIKANFDSAVVSRGVDYQKAGTVIKLSFKNNILKGVVHGSSLYDTEVRIQNRNNSKNSAYQIQLESECTCPYELECKHGVALVAQWIELRENTGLSSQIVQGNFNRKKEQIKTEAVINAESDLILTNHFSKMKLKDLAAYTVDLLRNQPEKYEEKLIAISIAQGDITTQAHGLNSAIQRLEKNENMTSANQTALLTNIIKLTKSLHQQGQWETIVTLIKPLLLSQFRLYRVGRITRQMLVRLEEIMPVLTDSVEKNRLSAQQKFIFWLELLLWDPEKTLIRATETLGKIKRDAKFWQIIASDFKKMMLDRLALTNGKYDLSGFGTGLDLFSDELIDARLDHIAEELYRFEAQKSGDDKRLKEFFKNTDDIDKLRGLLISKINDKSYGFNRKDCKPELLQLIQMAERNEDFQAVLGLYTFWLFEIEMNEQVFEKMFQVADKVALKNEMAHALVDYLHANKSPFYAAESKDRNMPLPEWPVELPTFLKISHTKNNQPRNHGSNIIILILIKANLFERALEYYENNVADRKNSDYSTWSHSHALDLLTLHFKKSHTERCIAYHLDLLQNYLKETTEQAYITARIRIELMFDIFAQIKQEDQWFGLVKNLKETFHKRRNFTKMLENLETNKHESLAKGR